MHLHCASVGIRAAAFGRRGSCASSRPGAALRRPPRAAWRRAPLSAVCRAPPRASMHRAHRHMRGANADARRRSGQHGDRRVHERLGGHREVSHGAAFHCRRGAGRRAVRRHARDDAREAATIVGWFHRRVRVPSMRRHDHQGVKIGRLILVDGLLWPGKEVHRMGAAIVVRGGNIIVAA